MKCKYCGASIPEGMMYCPDCRMEVQMVPDYNPLDDVLAREVKGSVEGATRPIQSGDVRRYSSREAREDSYATRVLNQGEYGSSTRVLNQGEMNRIRSEYMRRPSGSRSAGRSTGNMRRNTGGVRTDTGRRRSYTGELQRGTQERRHQQVMRRRQAAKKRLQRIMIIFLLILAVCVGIGVVVYQNSYRGILGKGQRAFQTGDYSTAERYFQQAIERDNKKADAYMALANLYIQQKNQDEAEKIFLAVIDSQPENAELYTAAIQFYVDTKQLEKIPILLDGCDRSVLSKVEEYVSEVPEFSLEEATYSEVQQVSLEGDGKIYYTTDGTEPTSSSILYEEPILVNEGTTVIKAISINKKGIPSLVGTRTYTVELPVEDAPAVTPSTGQYSTPMQISIQVPEGYKAYYTMDDTVPSAASILYTGPVEMPEGSTIFSAILVSDSGKMTQVTKRNYVLEYGE